MLRSPTLDVERRRTDLRTGEKDGGAPAPEETGAPLTVREWAELMFRNPPPLIDYDAQMEQRGIGRKTPR